MSTKTIDYLAEGVYFMRALVGFIRPAGKTQFEYRIRVVNKSGEGQSSNAVMVVVK